jgi:hypothetical protein
MDKVNEFVEVIINNRAVECLSPFRIEAADFTKFDTWVATKEG